MGWRALAWRHEGGVGCLDVRRAGERRRTLAIICHGARSLAHRIRTKPQAYVGSDSGDESTKAVFGFVRATVGSLTVVGLDGRRWRARLSPPFATVGSGPTRVRARAFLAAVPGPSPESGNEYEFEYAEWPPGLSPPPGGTRAQLAVPGLDGDEWTLDVFRRRGSGTSSAVRIPGSIDYCLGVSRTRAGGTKRWNGITCGLSTAIALRVNRHGLKPDCGGGGVVLGEPAPPQPTCGLVGADVRDVTVAAEDGLVATAQLSEPFRVRYNRSSRILRRSGIDPKRIRELPRTFLARAFLAFVPTPPTPPGGRSPRLTITATRANGEVIDRSIGGGLFPLPPPQPSLKPDPGAPSVRLAVTANDRRRWRSTAWRNAEGGLCANVSRAPRGPSSLSVSCHGSRQLMSTLRGGPHAYTGDPGPVRGSSYPVYGFVRGQALALTVIDRRGRRWNARLSRVFTTIHRHGRGIRVRAFLAALPGPPPGPERSLEFETKLSTGYTESTSGGRFPGTGEER